MNSFIDKILLESLTKDSIKLIYQYYYWGRKLGYKPPLKPNEIDKVFYQFIDKIKFIKDKQNKPEKIDENYFVRGNAFYQIDFNITKFKNELSNPNSNFSIYFREDSTFFIQNKGDHLEFYKVSAEQRKIFKDLFLFQNDVRKELYKKRDQERIQNAKKEKEIERSLNQKNSIYMFKDLNFFIDLVSKKVIKAKNGYFSFGADYEALEDKKENELFHHDYGDTLAVFDKTKLPNLVKLNYRDYGFWIKNPKIFEYVTNLKFSSNLETFKNLNNDTIENLELEEITSLKQLILTILDDISYEKESILKGILRFSPGVILAIKPVEKLKKQVKELFEKNGIKVLI